MTVIASAQKAQYVLTSGTMAGGEEGGEVGISAP